MLASEAEVQRLACEMIKQHGPQAAFHASERVNDRIDEHDWDGRDAWARVVQAIHELQRANSGSSSITARSQRPEAGPTRR
jgi:hypothetical protein